MATIDSSLFNGWPAGESATHSFSFTNTNGDFLVVCVSGFRGRTISALTYNGVSLTQRATYMPWSTQHVNIWTLASPAKWANTIAITLSGTDAPTFQVSSWIWVSGIWATGTWTTGTSTTPSASITTTQNGSIIVDALHSNWGSGVTRTPTNTLIAGWVDTVYATEWWHSQYKNATSPGTTTTSWTLSASNAWWMINLELKSSNTSAFLAFM